MFHEFELVAVDIERPLSRSTNTASFRDWFLIAGIDHVIDAKEHAISGIESVYVLNVKGAFFLAVLLCK